jgi:hypothetical protein
MKTRATLIAAMVSLSVACAFAADWPWIYGPRRNSTSDQKGLLRTWPKEGPKVLWTAPVGAGFGAPAIVGNKIYLLDRDETVGDKLRCFDLATAVMLEPGTNWAPLALVDGKLFIRDQSQLKCLQAAR